MISDDNCESLIEGEYIFAMPICACTTLEIDQEAKIHSLLADQTQTDREDLKTLTQIITNFVKEVSDKTYTELSQFREDYPKLKFYLEQLSILLEKDIDDEELVDEAYVSESLNSQKFY